jgi:hypothetical protein
MAINIKKFGPPLAAGTILIVFVMGTVFAASIQSPDTNQPYNTQDNSPLGKLVIYIKDAPVDLSALTVTISSLAVQGETGWTNLNFTEETTSVTFDLLSLENVTKELSLAELPVGNYSKIRLQIEAASATFEDSGETVTLKVPSERIDVIVKFEVKEDAVTQVLIDMTADWVAISNSHNLRPVLKATVIPVVEPTATPEESPTSPPETSTPTPTQDPQNSPSPTPWSTTTP